MDLDLTGKTAIVTGAGRGIGLAIVTALLREGASVVAASRAETDETRALAGDDRFRFFAVDLTEPDAAARLVAYAGDRIDIVVNNVGSAPARPGGFESIGDDQWMQTFTLNLLAAVRVCRSALPLMTDGGAIVTVASENSLLPDPLVMDYSAAKAGLLSFSKALSKEVASRGIRVNSVSPGPVSTALWLGGGGVAETVAAATGARPEDVRKGAEASMPTGRFTRPEEVADLVAVLASPRFGNLTGADVVIDGGLRQTI